MTALTTPDLDIDIDDDTPPPLPMFHIYGTDKRILDLLRDGTNLGLPTGLLIHRVTAIGRHHRAWTGTDVLRVHRHHITGDQWHPYGWDGNERRPDREPTPCITITRRQSEILDMLCRGLDVTAIVTATGLTRSTVNLYVRTIARLLDTTNGQEAARHARHGWVRLYLSDTTRSHATKDAA